MFHFPVVNSSQKVNVTLLGALKADTRNGMAVFCREGELFRQGPDNLPAFRAKFLQALGDELNMEAVHVVFAGQILEVLCPFEHAVYHFFRILHRVVPSQTDQVFGGDVRVFAAGLQADVVLQKSGLTKEDVKPLADAGNLDAAIVLLLGETSRKIGDTWVEDFEDEDTHKVVQVERHNYSDDFIFEPDATELQELGSLIASHIPFENMPVILSHLLSDLADNYAEQQCGFPKDKEKAREYPLYLDQIEYMVEDLTKAHGDPGNELGLFVNLMYIFKTLGFDWVDNTGNLMHINRHNEAVLTLELECNPRVDEALVEAFQKAYPKLTVEVVD